MHSVRSWEVLAVGLALTVGAAELEAQSWPQWRGPARDGVAEQARTLVEWPSELSRGWRVGVGIGHSSPVVASGRVFQHARQGESEVVWALELATGRSVWSERYRVPYQMHSAARLHGKGPKATPVLSEGRLYTLGISGIVSCWRAATGELEWRRDLAGEFPASSPLYGAAMSPVIHSGRLVVHLGGHDDGALMAFDAVSGKRRWAWDGDGPGYGSPVVATLGGVEQVVTLTQSQVVGVSLSDGRPLWTIPFTTAYDQNAVTPLVRGGVVIYSGLDQGTHAVRIVKRDGSWNAEPVWDNAEVSMYMSSPVSTGHRVFGLSHRDKGQFFCLDLDQGETLWKSRGRQARNASLIHAGGHLLALTTAGEMIVMRPDAEGFAPLATYTVAETPTWAHPAVVGEAVLVKDQDHLTLWRRAPGP